MWRKNSRRQAVSLGVTRLEDRTVPAGNITVIVNGNGSGSLDGFLFDATPGVISSTDGGSANGTLSTGALAAVGPTLDIAVSATGTITFNDLGGTLTLRTAAGRNVSFNAGGVLTVTNPANTLATGGGGLALGAVGNVNVFNLNSGGGLVSLTAGANASSLVARSIQAGTGSVGLQATSGATTTISQSGTVVGGPIVITASGGVSVDDLRGASVALRSDKSSVSSVGVNPIQAGQLTMEATGGITVTTLVGSVAAVNHTSGNISITQAASPARPLSTAPAVGTTGVLNESGTITITNLGEAITLAGGAGVQNTNGPITLAGLDFNINAAVNSGTARTTLANSTAGRPFDLGANTAGKIGLSAAELNNVTAGVLQIGGATAGSITLSAAVGPFNGGNTLVLFSNDGINQFFGAALTAANLRVNSPIVSISAANNVGTFAGSASAGNLVFTSGVPLIIGTVDGATGVVTTGGGLSIAADSLDVQQALSAPNSVLQITPRTSGRPLSLGGEVPGQLSLTDAELGRLTAGVVRLGNPLSGPLSVNAGVTRHAGYGTLTLTSSAQVEQTAPLSVSNLRVEGSGVTLFNVGNDVDTLAGLTGNFSFADTNAVAIGTVDGVNGIANALFVTLNIAGAITDGNGPGVNVTGRSLNLTAGGGVDLDLDVLIVANVSANGPVTLSGNLNTSLFGLNPGGWPITLDGGVFIQADANGIAPGSSLVIAGSTLNLNYNLAVSGLQLASGSITGTATLTSATAFDVRSGSISAPLAGGVGLIKSTAGIVTLSGANTYTGVTTITGGTLLINGNLVAGSSVTVNGGTLGGTGTVGRVSAISGAIAPGSSPGLLTANGNVTLAPSAAFVAEVNGATAGSQYDQLKVNGTVSFTTTSLILSVGGGFTPAAGNQFVIIDNDGTDAVSGTFAGLSEGATVTANGQSFTVSYLGGTGNDVVLTRTATPPLAVSSVVVNAGKANLVQRSEVTNVTVTFSRLVSFVGQAAEAFRLARTGPGAIGNVTLAVDLSGSTATQTVARLTFTGALTEGSAATPSLVDGIYSLTVFSGQVQGGVLGGDNVSSLFRLFGDVNGDKAVNGLDLAVFRTAFGTTLGNPTYLDFLDQNGDGAINGLDLAAFRSRFGTVLP